MRLKTFIEILVIAVLISGAAFGAVVVSDIIKEDTRLRREQLARMEARLDSLKARYVRDSIAVEEFRARWDSLAATADTILQLRK